MGSNCECPGPGDGPSGEGERERVCRGCEGERVCVVDVRVRECV